MRRSPIGPLSGGEGLPTSQLLFVVFEVILVALVAFAASIALANKFIIRPMETRERTRVQEIVQAQTAEAHRLREVF